jgi:muconate cycloisomerase
VLVKIETDEGFTGIGEAATDIGFFGEPLESVKVMIDKYLGWRLIGKDPFNREEILHQIDFRGNTCAKSGIDLALHDLIGKALNVPVCQLVGGCHQDKFLVSLEIHGATPEEMTKLCMEQFAKGIRAFVLKIGGYPNVDVEKVRAVREGLGDKVSLRADANQGFTVREAIAFCKKVEKLDLGLEMLEQPVAAWDLDGMAKVRKAVDTLIVADESAFSIHDVINIIKRDAADVINIKMAKNGGLYNAKKVAAIVEAADLQAIVGTEWGLGTKIAAKLHLAASTRNIKDPLVFSEIVMHDTLLATPLEMENGYLNVPQKPGFGVELDKEKIRKYTSNTAGAFISSPIDI